MNPNISPEIRIFLLGMLGGLVHVLVFGFRPFRTVQKLDDGSKIYDFGWLGHIFLGGISAYIVWASGLGNPDVPQANVLAIISGLVGAELLRSYSSASLLQKFLRGLSKEFDDSENENDGKR